MSKRDKKKVDVDVSYNTFVNGWPKGIIPQTNNMQSFITNCHIKQRDGDTLFSFYDNDDGTFLIPTLDKYAIIPMEDYVVYQKWCDRKKNIRVLNGVK